MNSGGCCPDHSCGVSFKTAEIQVGEKGVTDRGYARVLSAITEICRRKKTVGIAAAIADRHRPANTASAGPAPGRPDIAVWRIR